MTTESDAVLGTIVDNWGNGGYSGDTPAIQSTADIMVDRWAALDAVIVLHDTLDERHPRANDKFANKVYTMDIRVVSITSEDQLKLLVEEVEYLINNTAITGFSSAEVTRKWRGTSDRRRKVYRNDISIKLKALLSSSAIAPDGGSATNMNALLMYEAANKAWVPCAFETGSTPGKVNADTNTNMLLNLDATDNWWNFVLPIPLAKGTLKLYIDAVRVGLYDADTGDFVSRVNVRAMKFDAGLLLNTDDTDYKSQQLITQTFTATDVSSYEAIRVLILCTHTNAGDTDIASVSLRCYYDT